MTLQQLVLPIRSVRIPKPPVRAKRDFTAAEFAAALARNGFRALKGGLKFADTSGGVFDGVTTADPIRRLRRRATLAKIIRDREERP